MPICGEENGLAAKRSAGIAPEMNLREHVTHISSTKSANKAAQSGFETQRRRRNKCIPGVSVVLFFLKKIIFAFDFANCDWTLNAEKEQVRTYVTLRKKEEIKAEMYFSRGGIDDTYLSRLLPTWQSSNV